MSTTDGRFVRQAETWVAEALQDTPVVLVHGPRQSGKTTLVHQYPERSYVTLDDGLVLDAVLRKPDAFLAAHAGPLTIDEVQRAPSLFRAIKASVDRDRKPGRYLLTGSANAMLLPKLSDSLAGRMESVTLWPLAQYEMEGSKSLFVDRVFHEGSSTPDVDREDLRNRMTSGGFPEPVLRKSETRRRAWFEAYVKALVERDVRDLAQIDGLAVFHRLLRALANRLPETLNVSWLSRETGVPHTTLTRYLTLLEAVFLIVSIPAWTAGRSIRSPKLVFSDTGVLSYLLGLNSGRLQHEPELEKRLLENFVAMELVKQSAFSLTGCTVMHFRSVRQFTVPLLLERPDGKIVGIDLTESQRAAPEDFKGLEFLAELAGERFAGGVLLHLGSESQHFADNLRTEPIASIWQ